MLSLHSARTLQRTAFTRSATFTRICTAARSHCYSARRVYHSSLLPRSQSQPSDAPAAALTLLWPSLPAFYQTQLYFNFANPTVVAALQEQIVERRTQRTRTQAEREFREIFLQINDADMLQGCTLAYQQYVKTFNETAEKYIFHEPAAPSPHVVQSTAFAQFCHQSLADMFTSQLESFRALGLRPVIELQNVRAELLSFQLALLRSVAFASLRCCRYAAIRCCTYCSSVCRSCTGSDGNDTVSPARFTNFQLSSAVITMSHAKVPCCCSGGS